MSNPAFHPELSTMARFLPRGVGRPWLVPLLRMGPRRGAPRKLPRGLTFREEELGTAHVRVFFPERAAGLRPAILWIHGGGFIGGSAWADDGICIALAQQVGAVVVSVGYRLAPEHPFPAPLEDCFTAFEFIHREAAALGVDTRQVILAGQSAGGGLAAGLALLVRDRARPAPLLQVLVYPMLDDRTVQTPVDGRFHRLWDQQSNRLGWTAYLGGEPGSVDVSPYAAPSRSQDLKGLPRTWLGVGTMDLFHNEDLAYAQQLRAAGVEVELHVVPGAFHGFDRVAPGAACTRAFLDAQVAAMRRACVGG